MSNDTTDVYQLRTHYVASLVASAGLELVLLRVLSGYREPCLIGLGKFWPKQFVRLCPVGWPLGT